MNKLNSKLFEDMLEASSNRRTAKQYDMNRDVEVDTLNKIYEFAKTAPSSMGLELTRLVSINRTSKFKKEVNDHLKGFNQERAFMSSNLTLIITKTKDFYNVNNEIINERAERMVRGIAKIKGEDYIEGSHKSVVEAVVNSDHANNNSNLEEWGARQGYIVLPYLLLGASTLGVETTTMEGFTPELSEYLRENGVIDSDERVTLIVAMGYVDENNKMNFIGDKQTRINTDEFVKILN